MLASNWLHFHNNFKLHNIFNQKQHTVKYKQHNATLYDRPTHILLHHLSSAIVIHWCHSVQGIQSTGVFFLLALSYIFINRIILSILVSSGYEVKHVGTNQGKALRLVYENYESRYELLLKRKTMICLQLFYLGCLRSMNTEVLKALNRSSPSYIIYLLKKDIIFNLCSIVSLNQLKCTSLIYGLNSFQYKCAKIWKMPSK